MLRAAYRNMQVPSVGWGDPAHCHGLVKLQFQLKENYKIDENPDEAHIKTAVMALTVDT